MEEEHILGNNKSFSVLSLVDGLKDKLLISSTLFVSSKVKKEITNTKEANSNIKKFITLRKLTSLGLSSL